MTKRNAKEPTKKSARPEDVTLDSRYGAIGISAVAAALQFKSETKNASSPSLARHEDEERITGKAA
jgi:hypothetical protein